MRTITHLMSLPACLLIGLAALPAKAEDHIVNIFPSGYAPDFLSIAPGDTVIWVNQDDFPHTVTSANGLWNTLYFFDFLDAWGLTFPGAGTYQYSCDFDGFAGTISVGSVVAPANDQCSGAIAMTSGTVYTMNTAGATSASDPSLVCESTLGKGVWYTFTATASGPVAMSTCGSDFDTVLAVYTGSCGSLTPVPSGCNDDNGPACTAITASATFSATAGTTYQVLVGGYGGNSGNLQIVMTQTAGPSDWFELKAPFDIGLSIAEPHSNRVHIVDRTNDCLLTLDTDTGAFISSIRLQGKPGNFGYMCLSLDQRFLYVPLSSAQMLQVISLTDLATTDIVPLSAVPTSVAAGVDGALYAIAGGQLTKIDPSTGRNLGSLNRNFYSPVLKSNPSGTRLYIMELGLSGGGSMIDEFAVVASALPQYVASHYTGKANDKDFVVAEDINTLYSTSGGVYGIGVWDMSNRTYRFWPFDSAYGAAVALVPNDTYVYGASGNYIDPRIRRFNKLTGTISETYDIHAAGRPYGAVLDRSLKVTPNNTIFYAREDRRIGLIGAPAFSTNLPATAELVYAGADQTVASGATFNLSALAPSPTGTEVYSWSRIAGPGPVTFSKPNGLVTTAQATVAGSYVLEIARTNDTLVSRDRVNVTVVSTPIRIEQATLTTGGRLQMQLSSDPGWLIIEATSDFRLWNVVTNVLNQNGRVTVTDPEPNPSQRFYRAKPGP